MAGVLDDGEFWLLPRLLADDDLFVDKGEVNDTPPNDLFPYELPSDLSSPVESVVGSTETDSDEEDYLVGLTRQMARYTLEDDFGGNDTTAFASKNSKSSSPESTLCAFRSSHGSSNCQSRVSSSPGTWALLFSAAEEAATVRMKKEAHGGFNNKGLIGRPAKKPSPNQPPSGSYPHQSLSLKATQFQQVKQSQLMRQQHNPQVWRGKKQQHQQHVALQNSANRPSGLFPSACTPLQQQPKPKKGSGMGAVFLDNPTGKRECVGTGVFLPRRVGTAETRKKQARSTILLPVRVVQALNLNLVEINAQPHLRSRFNVGVTTDGGKRNTRGNHISGAGGNFVVSGGQGSSQQLFVVLYAAGFGIIISFAFLLKLESQ
ncbi:hypothetical protein V6N13_140783 [Hibiscus sabdariffa]|uniref:Uncharacterized protein n=1 Tax=Hibiscus sabdariffa TaxID=183260 RepID=A0ABR2Q1V7_9ROSI